MILVSKFQPMVGSSCLHLLAQAQWLTDNYTEFNPGYPPPSSHRILVPLGGICLPVIITMGFPGGSDEKEFACNIGDPGSIPGLGRFPGERNGYPLQCSCLENAMNGGAWWAIVFGGAKSKHMTEQLTFSR